MTWLWIALLAAASLGGGVGTGWPLLQHLGIALFGLEALGLLMVRGGVRGLSVTPECDRTRLTAGDEIVETYWLENRGLWPAFRIELEDADTSVHVGLTSVSLWSGQSILVTRRRRVERRGRLAVGTCTVRVLDPFGLFCSSPLRYEPMTVTVYPRSIEVPEVWQAIGTSGAGQHRRWLDSAEATRGDLRLYQTGDPPSRIHWRSSAHTGTLMVAEPESRRHRAIWLLVDLGGGEEVGERAAGMATYVLQRLCQAGQQIAAVIAGEELTVVAPGRGREQGDRVLEPLATMAASRQYQVEQLLQVAARCEVPGAIVLVTAAEDLGGQWNRLQRRCPRGVVLDARTGTARSHGSTR